MVCLKRILVLFAALLGSATLLPHPARACGGLFCSASTPVDQSDERIIFSHNADDTVTAVIQIFYRGPSEHFAWVLPVPGTPDVGVSTDRAFDALEARTAPDYDLTRSVAGRCAEEEPVFYEYGADASMGPDEDELSADAGVAPEPVVSIESRGSVGPYDFVVLSVDKNADEPEQRLVEWLQDNGYDVFERTAKVIAPYIEDGLNLLAIKLTKNSQTGSIRPLRVTYASRGPSIPIRPTALASIADMGVKVWLLGEARAVPANYRGLELNEVLINWFNWRGSYEDAVTAAADEAGAHGFVTELAAETSKLNLRVLPSGAEATWDNLNAEYARGDFASGMSLLLEAGDLYRFWDGFRDAVGAGVSLPPDVSLDEFGRDPVAYEDVSGLHIDQDAFMQALRTYVVEPAFETQALLESRPYLTRLYTTLSPAEMTEDPFFVWNAELDDVDNAHQAHQTIHCSDRYFEDEAPWTIEFENGMTLAGAGSTWPVRLGDEGMVSNFRILQLSEQGSGEVVEDNTDLIAEALDALNASFQAMLDADDDMSDDTNDDTDSSGDISDEPTDNDQVVDNADRSDDANEPSAETSESGDPKFLSGGCALTPRTPSPGGRDWSLLLLMLGLGRRRRGTADIGTETSKTHR